MEETLRESNSVSVTGYIASDLEFNHEVYGEKFYSTKIATARLSSYEDCIPLIISERLINIEEDLKGKSVHVIGRFSSRNIHNGLKHTHELFLFAKEIEFVDEGCKHENKISLEGYLCKSPVYRKTPLGREIADALLAVNRAYGKSDYIPCIFWGRDAHFISELDIGSHIKIKGRIQSREYVKKINENESETRTAYEVSATEVYTLED